MDPQQILTLARQRAQQMNLPYAGALLPVEAHTLMLTVPSATLVDIRTGAELEGVGRVANSIFIEWSSWPAGARNPNFNAELEKLVDKQALVMFLCRSGVRSNAAAIAAAQVGYSNAYNVSQGFEGDKDASGQRNKLGGWCAAGLRWTQN